ncbi:unnamed protein product [Gongylonema pulchrum]|uniref:F-BAR domain-containing protein n=1 Tax=Gongylonema pulchrum TaxID=637853 RepID=A0A3P7N7N2_9BILA|nr:unnamed protein product [Gongylonema pulchrum]
MHEVENLAGQHEKEDEEAAKSFTFISSFHSILHEVENLAGQHEIIAEGLRKDIHSAVLSRCSSLRAARKSHLNELHIIHGVLNSSIDNMIKFQKNYWKAFKDAEVAHLKYDKAEKNMDLSRADLEKAKNNAMQRTQICEDAKQNYAHALQAANQQQYQHYNQLLPQILEICEDAKQNYAHALQAANQQQYQHYNQLLPQILERLRAVDEERICETKSLMLKSIEAETRVMNIIQRCYEDMNNAAQSISPASDTASVVEQYR